jgi:hypothetical protein
MADAIRTNAGHLTKFNGAAVAGYVTGSGSVPWTGATFDLFPHKYKVRINQHDNAPALLGNVFDVETNAWKLSDVVAAIEARHNANRHVSVYLSKANLPTLANELTSRKLVASIWLANWDLTEAEARAAVEAASGPFPLVAVQFASPSSNPDTEVPGAGGTLKALGADLSVASVPWLDAVAEVPVGQRPPQPPPAPPETGLLITSPLKARKVTSHDHGVTWHI